MRKSTIAFIFEAALPTVSALLSSMVIKIGDVSGEIVFGILLHAVNAMKVSSARKKIKYRTIDLPHDFEMAH